MAGNKGRMEQATTVRVILAAGNWLDVRCHKYKIHDIGARRGVLYISFYNDNQDLPFSQFCLESIAGYIIDPKTS